jgi:hypothetical protein
VTAAIGLEKDEMGLILQNADKRDKVRGTSQRQREDIEKFDEEVKKWKQNTEILTNQNVVAPAEPAHLVATSACHVVAAAVLLDAVVALGTGACVHARPHRCACALPERRPLDRAFLANMSEHCQKLRGEEIWKTWQTVMVAELLRARRAVHNGVLRRALDDLMALRTLAHVDGRLEGLALDVCAKLLVRQSAADDALGELRAACAGTGEVESALGYCHVDVLLHAVHTELVAVGIARKADHKGRVTLTVATAYLAAKVHRWGLCLAGDDRRRPW